MSPFRHSHRPAYGAGAHAAPTPAGRRVLAPRAGAVVLVPAGRRGAS
ncbi:hypothetical protein PUR61_35000 [Streptomyces sp. BE20]|nr:hypothetical protein [Streptomyces sp. BE20]MEE1827361.1 hypothetical protein [Streptomyces sp. BE20]